MRASTLSALAAISLLAVGISGAAAGSPSRLVIRTQGPIGAVALAGSHLAYFEQRAFPPRCSRIVLVDVSSRKRLTMSGGEKTMTCGSEFARLAVGGNQAAWIVADDSNTEQWSFLEGAALPHPKEHKLATSILNAGYGVRTSGTRLENLVGAGSLLVVGRWWQNARNESPRSVVYAVSGNSVHRIIAGRQAIWPQAVDQGRIAVLHGSALEHASMRLEIYDRHGARQVSIALPPLNNGYRGDAIALQGGRLLVLTPKGRLQIYDSHTGRRLGSRPVPNDATNLDVYGGIAVYAAHPDVRSIGDPYELHALRLSTGKDVVLDRGVFTSQRNLEFDSSGLAYVKGQRTIVFLPLARVRAAVS